MGIAIANDVVGEPQRIISTSRCMGNASNQKGSDRGPGGLRGRELERSDMTPEVSAR